MNHQLSIVMPALDEASGIKATLDALAPLRERGCEVIVVDGGSRDGTAALCVGRADLVGRTRRGRARQMNAGAAMARGDVLLFLHADTLLPPHADRLVLGAIERGALWGRFDVRIDGRAAMLRWVGALMNLRSAWTGIATGDQAIFVRRDVFERLGRFPDQDLMEDVELSSRLRREARPVCLHQQVLTSGRRWESRGVWRTIALMWRLRWLYWTGTPPNELARDYA